MPKIPTPLLLLLPLLLPKPKSLTDDLKKLAFKATTKLININQFTHSRTSESSISNNTFDVHIKNIPVFLPIESVAPQIDPEHWGEYISIKTSNANKSESWDKGWKGTIQENIDFGLARNIAKILGLNIGKFENILNIEEFSWDETGGVVNYSLNNCLTGDLTVDQGQLTVTPQDWGGCYVSCRKVLAFEEDSDWLKPQVKFSLYQTMHLVIFMWVIEYSLKIMLKALRDNPSLEKDPKIAQAKKVYTEILNSSNPEDNLKKQQEILNNNNN